MEKEQEQGKDPGERECPHCYNVMVFHNGEYYCRNCHYNSLPTEIKDEMRLSKRRYEEAGKEFSLDKGERAKSVTLTPDFMRKIVRAYGSRMSEILAQKEKSIGLPGPHALCEKCKKLLSAGENAILYDYKAKSEAGNMVNNESVLCSPECQHEYREKVRAQNAIPIRRY